MDFKTPPKNIKQPKSTTTTTTTTTNDATIDNPKGKGKKMLSLDILNGKGTTTNPNKKQQDTTKPIRPPGQEKPLEKVVVDLQVSGRDQIGTTKKIKNKEVEEVFMSIPGNKIGNYNNNLQHQIFTLSFFSFAFRPHKFLVELSNEPAQFIIE